MQLAKSITLKKIKTLRIFLLTFVVLFFSVFSPAFSQDNSPYSRFGIGDLVPATHIIGRSMGGISAGYNNFLSINFNNPASYSSFQAIKVLKSKKLISGRAVLDLGLNFEGRTLKEPKSLAPKFIANNALFSYVQVGVPLNSNWGLSFGLRPVSRISYNIISNERLVDPLTGLPIDSATTRFEGDGGSYLASFGTGVKLFHRDTKNGEEKLSIGINGGYLFGQKNYSTKRSLINDTVVYNQAFYETKTTYGNIYFNAGAQYKVPLKKNVSLTLGAYGNWSQKLNASRDVSRETFLFDPNQGIVRLDSVSDLRNEKGKIISPSSLTVGFVTEKIPFGKEGGWLFGIDFTQQNWDQYRSYGQKDSVKNKWELHVGTQLRPASKRNYFSNVAYRAGFFLGPDYIKVNEKLSQIGISFGLGLPVSNYRSSYASANQATLINIAFEYGKRGNNNNLLRENTFRFSLGFSLSDLWFGKKKFD